MKFKCESCGKDNAEWCYMPKSHYLCDECITPSNLDYNGCSCNWYYIDVNAYQPPLSEPDLPKGKEGKDWKWVKENVSWQYIDGKGRPFPCCEYEYSKYGWDQTTFDVIHKLDNKQDYQKALDVMNNYFNNWINSGCYDVVDKLLKSFIMEDYSLSLNLNLLLLTNKVKKHLNKVGDGRYSLFEFTNSKYLENVSSDKANSLEYLQ